MMLIDIQGCGYALCDPEIAKESLIVGRPSFEIHRLMATLC